ncbi:MAG: hypothetical protein ABR80_00875 [Cryomorphaceae bacterium BACL11 MAG-121015-bin20]|jgi:hypothetical protein|nr:MAG: hypothetical protein ABR80_00875 [Cryomorphaceae bacterium BACL11 MAG-121015-bin20]
MLALTNISYNQDAFFILVLLSFLLIALIKGMYWKHAKLFFMGVFAQRYANQYLREENAFTERVNFLTFLLMAINFTLIITKFQAVIDLPTIVSVFFLVLLFFLLKLILIKLLGFFFKVKDLAKLAIFFSLLFDKTLGFVLFPLVVVIYFFSVDISSTVLMISLGLFIILFMLKLFWLWKIGTNSFGLSQVYIFLYLCTIEIFPLLLLAKGIFY